MVAEKLSKTDTLRAMSQEDIDRLLSGREYIVLVDKSASMGTPDAGNGITRWNYASEIVGMILAAAASYDADGSIDLGFFGAATSDSDIASNYYQNVTEVAAAFPDNATDGATYFGAMLDWLFRNKLNNLTKPVTIMVLLDGQVSDPDLTIAAIKNAAKYAEDGEKLAIGLMQIGLDRNATTYLETLDNNLGEIDIVDASTFDEVKTFVSAGDIKRLMVAAIID